MCLRVILSRRIKKILENKNSKNFDDKNKKNFGVNVHSRSWIKGDLVKINDFDITGLPSYYYGVVSDEPVPDEQMELFPSINVYCLFDGILRPVELYKLELVSSAK